MDIGDLPLSPPTPARVTTPSEDSQGQDLLGLRAPAERIAIHLMNGVTTISPLVRYLGFRAWILKRYVHLAGPKNRTTFHRFSGKCEAALVLGHKLAALPLNGMVGADRASEELLANPKPVAKKLTRIIAMQTYSGPSQDLGFTFGREAVPHLTLERGVPLADLVDGYVGGSPALLKIDVDSEEQPLSAEDLAHLAQSFPMARPMDDERAFIIDALCPPTPRENEFRRLSAYAYLLHMADGAHPQLDQDGVLQDAVDGGTKVPDALVRVPDGWLKFLVRDLLVAAHEHAVECVLELLEGRSAGAAPIDAIVKELASSDPGEVLQKLGLPGVTAATPIRSVWAAAQDLCHSRWTRSGVTRWAGPLTELPLIKELEARAGIDRLAVLPLAWMVAALRSESAASDTRSSIDTLSGARQAQLGLDDVVRPAVREWSESDEAFASVLGRLLRRSVEQHLMVAWFRMQVAPERGVAAIVSDGDRWSRVRDLRGGRATSRLYRAIEWLGQLDLVSDSGITVDGSTLYNRSMRVLASAGGGA